MNVTTDLALLGQEYLDLACFDNRYEAAFEVE